MEEILAKINEMIEGLEKHKASLDIETLKNEYITLLKADRMLCDIDLALTKYKRIIEQCLELFKIDIDELEDKSWEK